MLIFYWYFTCFVLCDNHKNIGYQSANSPYKKRSPMFPQITSAIDRDINNLDEPVLWSCLPPYKSKVLAPKSAANISSTLLEIHMFALVYNDENNIQGYRVALDHPLIKGLELVQYKSRLLRWVLGCLAWLAVSHQPTLF